MLRLGLIQMRCSINRQENLDRAEAKVREAAAQGAKIICLPEIFATILVVDTNLAEGSLFGLIY